MSPATCSTPMEEGEEKGKAKSNEKEGHELLGSPTFKKIDNGRFRCVETGHEMPAKDKESYSHSKRCRLGLIDSALAHNTPPLSMFKQDPNSKSKLICNLTGDIINKSEEHIWKHINGSKFLNRLEKMESGKLASNDMVVEKDELKSRKVPKASIKGVKKDKKNRADKAVLEEKKKKPIDCVSDPEEPDFWSPPMGSRWDFDDGGDRWGSDTDSGQESDDGNGIEEVDEENGPEPVKEADEESSPESLKESDEENGLELEESEELRTGTKRMSIEVGPSSFASRKKKRTTNSKVKN